MVVATASQLKAKESQLPFRGAAGEMLHWAREWKPRRIAASSAAQRDHLLGPKTAAPNLGVDVKVSCRLVLECSPPPEYFRQIHCPDLEPGLGASDGLGMTRSGLCGRVIGGATEGGRPVLGFAIGLSALCVVSGGDTEG